jgi:hypothetical protein
MVSPVTTQRERAALLLIAAYHFLFLSRSFSCSFSLLFCSPVDKHD